MSDPRFSIVIPTYNRADFIGKTIESVLSQKFRHFELIVVDDGSTDDTESIVRQYVGEKVSYHKKENEERATARNFGTRLAKGDYIDWFDSDDVMLPDHLDEACRLIKARSEPEVIALSYQTVDLLSGKTLRKTIFPSIANGRLHKGNFLSCNGVMVRRDIALRFPFNEDRILSGSEDYDLWMRLAARFPIYCSPSITSILVEHDGRSMADLDMEKIEARIETAWKSLWSDDKIVEKYGKDRAYMHSFKESFLAVHYAGAKDPTKAKQKLRSAIRSHPLIIFHKTFLATVKRLVMG